MHRHTLQVFFLLGKCRLERELGPFRLVWWVQHQSLSIRPLPAFSLSLSLTRTMFCRFYNGEWTPNCLLPGENRCPCADVARHESMERQVSCQGRAASHFCKIWFISISKAGSWSLCFTALGKCFCVKKKQCMYYWFHIAHFFLFHLSFFDFLWEQRNVWPWSSACDGLKISCGSQWNAHEAGALLLLNLSYSPLTGGRDDECGRGILFLPPLLRCSYQPYS